MSNIEEYTKNFKFIIPEFNVATWHTEIKENFKAIDALIANFVQSQQYKGAWKQVTSYIVNDLVYINDEDSNYYGFLMRVKVNHITTGDDFDTFLANNPTYYEVQGEMGAQIAALRAQDWAEKIDGMVTINEVPIDYSSKAYAIGGVGTETNNSKYFKEQAELARDGILLDPGFIAIKNDLLGDENIKTVADNIQNVNNVGNNILSILSVYNNLSDINVCVSNMSAIVDAPNQATNAQNSATSAANSAQLAQEAALSVTSFDLFDHKWEDHLLNNQNWLRADTFSWHPATTQYGTYLEAYNHLLNDIGYVWYMIPDDGFNIKFYRAPDEDTEMYAWTNSFSTLYTEKEFPENGDNFYYHNQIYGTVLSVDVEAGSGVVTPTTETIGSYTIIYYPAEDGHKIVLPDQETTVDNIYNESGVAWYYILDNVNQRFKLPRENPNLEKYTKLTSASVAVKGNNGTINVMTSGGVRNLYIDGHPSGGSGQTCVNAAGAISPLKLSTDPNTSGITGTADLSSASKTSVYKGKQYLYFYVGQFTQSATEQTAGLNTELFNNKVDIDFGNVDKSRVLGITNCLTNIPQDIKLEINNGTLILKAGSKIYVPNGFESDGTTLKFDIITIQSDISYTQPSTDIITAQVFYNTNNNTLMRRGTNPGSGSSVPSGFNSVFYNTSTNLCHNYTSGTQGSKLSFPICICTSNGQATNNISSINQTFNGFGYIGATVFALPGLKGLIPNGRNADGTLKSTVTEITAVTIKNYSGTQKLVWGFTAGNNIYYQTQGAVIYDEEKNTTNWQTVIFASGKVTGGSTISDFTTKPVFHAVDYNDAVKYSDKEQVVRWGVPDFTAAVQTAANTDYTTPSNGFIVAHWSVGTNDIYINDVVVFQYVMGYNTSFMGYIPIPVKKGTKIKSTISAIEFYPCLGG